MMAIIITTSSKLKGTKLVCTQQQSIKTITNSITSFLTLFFNRVLLYGSSYTSVNKNLHRNKIHVWHLQATLVMIINEDHRSTIRDAASNNSDWVNFIFTDTDVLGTLLLILCSMIMNNGMHALFFYFFMMTAFGKRKVVSWHHNKRSVVALEGFSLFFWFFWSRSLCTVDPRIEEV